jgi:pimeloyl-ACP methyl ester carboxylesterase
MQTHVHLSGLVAALVGSTALLTVQASAGPPEPTRRPPARTVSWAPCPGSTVVQCGTLRVPVDWSRPGGQQIDLAVARRPADDPSRRIGILFYNPGGPGDGPIDDLVDADRMFSDTLRQRFDLVGIDPRAVAGSAHVTCKVPILTPGDTLYPRTRAQFRQLRRHNRQVGLDCLRRTGPLLGHVDTMSVARDHDALRAALGEVQVSWLGLSYGTTLAANYADLFPGRTRVMVLDAALEHSQPEVSQVADEAMAAEDSFNRFVTWCRTAAACALRGRDVGTLFDRLVARADRHPIPVPGALRPVTGEDVRAQTIGKLRIKELSVFGPNLTWAALSQAIKAAMHGDAAAFALPPADQEQEFLSSLFAIGCMEYVPQVRTYADMKQRIRMGQELAPHLQGASETWQANRCIGWPVPAANPPRTLHVSGVPTLVVHASHDPSVAYKWAHSLAAQIEGSDLLTRIGDGHTSMHTSACARAAIDRYLVRTRARADRVCRDQ